MSANPLSNEDAIRALEESSSLSSVQARDAVDALNTAGLEVVESHNGATVDPDAVVRRLLDADVGLKDHGVIGAFSLSHRRRQKLADTV